MQGRNPFRWKVQMQDSADGHVFEADASTFWSPHDEGAMEAVMLATQATENARRARAKVAPCAAVTAVLID